MDHTVRQTDDWLTTDRQTAFAALFERLVPLLQQS